METHVYLIAHQDREAEIGPVKIGVSRKPLDRLPQIQTGNPYALTLCWSICFESESDAYFFECQLQRRLRELGKGMIGEWFDCHPQKALFHMAYLYEIAREGQRIAHDPSHSPASGDEIIRRTCIDLGFSLDIPPDQVTDVLMECDRA